MFGKINSPYKHTGFPLLLLSLHSSVSEILQLCSEDAEETLYELGFGRDEPQVTVRIPPRFLHFPSLSEGINFRVFLDSQLRRIREEDPSLTLASKAMEVHSTIVVGLGDEKK